MENRTNPFSLGHLELLLKLTPVPRERRGEKTESRCEKAIAAFESLLKVIVPVVSSD